MLQYVPGQQRIDRDPPRHTDRRRREVVRLRFDDGLLRREIAHRLGLTELHVSRILKDEIVRAHAYPTDPGPPAA